MKFASLTSRVEKSKPPYFCFSVTNQSYGRYSHSVQEGLFRLAISSSSFVPIPEKTLVADVGFFLFAKCVWVSGEANPRCPTCPLVHLAIDGWYGLVLNHLRI